MGSSALPGHRGEAATSSSRPKLSFTIGATTHPADPASSRIRGDKIGHMPHFIGKVIGIFAFINVEILKKAKSRWLLLTARIFTTLSRVIAEVERQKL